MFLIFGLSHFSVTAFQIRPVHWKYKKLQTVREVLRMNRIFLQHLLSPTIHTFNNIQAIDICTIFIFLNAITKPRLSWWFKFKFNITFKLNIVCIFKKDPMSFWRGTTMPYNTCTTWNKTRFIFCNCVLSRCKIKLKRVVSCVMVIKYVQYTIYLQSGVGR